MNRKEGNSVLGAKGRIWMRLGAFFLTILLMLYGFQGMFERCVISFNAKEEDMSFAWFVPLFSLYVLWTELKKIPNLRETLSKQAPSWGGMLACVPCLFFAFLGSRGLQVRFEILGFMGLCVAIPWAFFGWRVAKMFLFPALYLGFCIPLTSFLDILTVHLRLFASSTALVVLQGFGADVMRQGTAIISMGAHPFSIDVAEPCSGLRSIFALTALTAAYAWYNQPTWPRRLFLFAFAIPLAILGNVMRIMTICIVAAVASPNFATGFYHDYSGYVVFLVAIGLMVAIGEVMNKKCSNVRMNECSNELEGRVGVEGTKVKGERESVSAVESSEHSNIQTFKHFSFLISHFSFLIRTFEHSNIQTFLISLFALLVLGTAFVFQAHVPKTILMEPPKITLPENLPGFQTDGIRYCRNEKCLAAYRTSRLGENTAVCPSCGGDLATRSLGEATVLPSDTIIFKRYYDRAADGFSALVSVVIGGVSKSSIHRPELCLPAQGYLMREPRDFTVKGRPWHAVRIEGKNSAPAVLLYTFFNQEGFRTATHITRIFRDVCDRTFFNRIDRWVMVTVNAREVDEAFLEAIGKELP